MAKSQNSLIALQEELLSKSDTAERKKILSTEYGMLMTEELEGRLQTMCNLSQNILEHGIEKELLPLPPQLHSILFSSYPTIPFYILFLGHPSPQSDCHYTGFISIKPFHTLCTIAMAFFSANHSSLPCRQNRNVPPCAHKMPPTNV